MTAISSDTLESWVAAVEGSTSPPPILGSDLSAG